MLFAIKYAQLGQKSWKHVVREQNSDDIIFIAQNFEGKTKMS